MDFQVDAYKTEGKSAWLEWFFSQSWIYYHSLLLKLFKASPDKKHIALVAWIIRHDRVPLAMLNSQWRQRGLFLIGHSEARIAAPIIRRSILRTLADEWKEQFSALIKANNGNAWELFFLHSFLAVGGCSLRVESFARSKSSATAGLHRASHRDIEVTKVLFQDREHLDRTPLVPGSIIVCYQNHPAVDFVIWSKSAGNPLYLVQVSVDDFATHQKGRGFTPLKDSVVSGRFIEDGVRTFRLPVL